MTPRTNSGLLLNNYLTIKIITCSISKHKKGVGAQAPDGRCKSQSPYEMAHSLTGGLASILRQMLWRSMSFLGALPLMSIYVSG